MAPLEEIAETGSRPDDRGAKNTPVFQAAAREIGDGPNLPVRAEH